nr:transmembrane 9 superfamily member 4 [Anolis sagrei ordinatus]
MNSKKKCEVLCEVTLKTEESKLMAERIQEEYYVHLIADNLPVATRLEFYSNHEEEEKNKEKDVQFEHGYRLGFMDSSKFYLHNHLSFILYYHREETEENQEPTFRVVRFEVIPQSIKMVPFPTMVALLCMWFGISLPLVYLGYYFGFRKQPYDNPVRTNQIPRQIPEQRWYMNRFVGILMAGILPFGAMFIELFFIFSLQLDIVEFIPSLLYFGYTALMVLSFWLLTGTIGFYAAYMFVRKIYAAVKID